MHYWVGTKLFDALLVLGPYFSMHYWFWGQTFRCTIGFGAKLFDALLVWGQTFRCTIGIGIKLFDALMGMTPKCSMHSRVLPQHFRCTHGYGPNIFDALMSMAPNFSMHYVSTSALTLDPSILGFQFSNYSIFDWETRLCRLIFFQIPEKFSMHYPWERPLTQIGKKNHVVEKTNKTVFF